MRNPLHTPFATVFRNEVLLNSKRIAPYVLIVLFTANSILWWGWSVAATYGWSTNSDYNIVRNLGGFSFLLGMPIFNALIMGDPVIRDFRAGIDPLIFSKPLSRAAYLLGKFFGNFFVLVCCQSAFVLTMVFLQWVPKAGLMVGPVRVFPFFKHFFFFVVISHLLLAAIYFTVGTLTQSTKIVYGIAVAFYPIFFPYIFFLSRNFPHAWRVFLNPMGGPNQPLPDDKWEDANFVNQIVVKYTPVMVANRAFVCLLAAGCLTILYFRFRSTEQSSRVDTFPTLGLSTAFERFSQDAENLPATLSYQYSHSKSDGTLVLPDATISEGRNVNVTKLIAALSVEFRLLLSERSLLVIVPLTVMLSLLEVAFWQVAPDPSYSAAYASNTARLFLLFLIAIPILYIGEAMHRDRDLKIEPVLWSFPAPNSDLLLSKFLATLLLTISIATVVAILAIALQFLKGDRPVDLSAYLLIYSVILFPSIVFMTAISLALNVWLWNRYVTYAVSIGLVGGLFYLYSQGYKHWLYNPLLYKLWSYEDLVGSGLSTIVMQRFYWVAIAVACLSLAHVFYQRK